MEQVLPCVNVHLRTPPKPRCRVCVALGEFWRRVCAPGRPDGGRAASESEEEESRETRCHTDTGDVAPSVIVYIVIQLTDHKHGGICQQTKLLFFLCSA